MKLARLKAALALGLVCAGAAHAADEGALEEVVVRGVTQNDFADHQESPAAIYIDEVYVSQMAGLAFSLFDMERVEVLRGPQGTLFGRNATGGLANFITRKPTDTQEGYVNVTHPTRSASNRSSSSTRCGSMRPLTITTITTTRH
jgi:outer membrane receptor protein involved in Fe transport